MLKKIIAGLMLFASLSFGMSLTKLNGASKADLMEINGVGEVKASEIIKQRRRGKFKSFADLQERVDGIGEQTAANIKADVKNAEDVKKVVKKRKTTKAKAKNKKEKSTPKANAKTDKKKETTKKRTRKLKKVGEKKKELKKKTRKIRVKKSRAKTKN